MSNARNQLSVYGHSYKIFELESTNPTSHFAAKNFSLMELFSTQCLSDAEFAVGNTENNECDANEVNHHFHFNLFPLLLVVGIYSNCPKSGCQGLLEIFYEIT